MKQNDNAAMSHERYHHNYKKDFSRLVWDKNNGF